MVIIVKIPTALILGLLLIPAIVIAEIENNDAFADDDDTTASRLDTVVVEPVGEPDTDLPLGTGVSGKTLATTPGSGGDPLRSVQSLPGMVFADDTEPLPAVRGSGPDDNYFEVDFLATDYLFHVGGFISVFHPDLIKNFSIYPSAYGPEFTGVTGGVFDVELRDPKRDRFHASIDINLLQTGVLLEGPVNSNQSFYLAGRLSYLDFLIGADDEPDEEGFTLVQFPKYKDYQTKYVWQFSDNMRITAQANGAEDEAAADIEENAEDVATDPIIAGRLSLGSSFNQQAVTLDVEFSESMSLKSVIGHSLENDENFIGGAGSFEFDIESWISKSHFDLTLGESHDLTLGATVSTYDYKVDLDFNVPLCTQFEPDCTLTEAERIETKINDTATFGHLFLKDSWYVNDRLTLFPGLSVQTDNWLDGTNIEPRFALEYALSDSVLISAALGLYHQTPYFEQVNEEVGNPDLDYIESTQAVLGLLKEWGNGWEVKTELYYKKLNKLVTGDDELGYANQGEGETIGFDTLVRKELTDKLSGWLSLSLSDSTRTNRLTGEKFDFEYDQPVNASLVANYKLNSKWSLGAKLWAHSGALYTPVTGATPDPEIDGFYIPQYGALNSERFPIYQRLDLRVERVSRKASGRKYTSYFEIHNALGSKNVYEYEYNADYSERMEGEQTEPFFAFGFKAEF